MALFLGSYC